MTCLMSFPGLQVPPADPGCILSLLSVSSQPRHFPAAAHVAGWRGWTGLVSCSLRVTRTEPHPAYPCPQRRTAGPCHITQRWQCICLRAAIEPGMVCLCLQLPSAEGALDSVRKGRKRVALLQGGAAQAGA